MPQPIVRVLFVCLGNICRSPSAEGIFRGRVKQAGLQASIESDSAGSLAFQVGKAPDSRAQAVARDNGLNICDLRARLVCPDDFERFDYIIAMDRMNLADLEHACPAPQRQRLSLMLSHATQSAAAEVPDPYGGEVSFKQVWSMLDSAVTGLLERVRREHSL